MVASSSREAPLAVIIGVTGQQGGSVANALIQSNKPYRIVGLTRDASKPSAQAWIQKDVQLREVDISPGKEGDVSKAFEGADIVFAVTNSSELGTKEKEVVQGKLMIDAAKRAQVKLFIWSNAESPAKLSTGRFSAAWFFDSKDEVTDYLRDSNVPFALVPGGLYFSGLIRGPAARVKQSDGSYAVILPCPATTVVPVIDISRDYGTYVRAAIENPGMGPGSEILTGIMISYEDQVAQLSEFTGKKHTFRQASRDEWSNMNIANVIPTGFGDASYDAFQSVAEFGYYGDKDVIANQKAAGITPSTFREICQNQKPGTFD
ncbi:hypothetical protein FRB97_002580 [Tulasnella sp. 331]|nr:hypothetical protein FRB97_002580 [Tulasnella sp. 331]KAG8869548.1 hypothetical protein FRB98_002410 [Tulasnella sp. 332]